MRECEHGLLLSRCPAGCEGRPRLVLLAGGAGVREEPGPSNVAGAFSAAERRFSALPVVEGEGTARTPPDAARLLRAVPALAGSAS